MIVELHDKEDSKESSMGLLSMGLLSMGVQI